MRNRRRGRGPRGSAPRSAAGDGRPRRAPPGARPEPARARSCRLPPEQALRPPEQEQDRKGENEKGTALGQVFLEREVEHADQERCVEHASHAPEAADCNHDQERHEVFERVLRVEAEKLGAEPAAHGRQPAADRKGDRHLCGRQRAGGRGRRARRRVSRPRPAIPAQIPRVVPDRGCNRRPRARDWRVLRSAPDRRARLRAQEIPAPGRYPFHFRLYDPAPALAAGGPVREEGDMIAPAPALAEHPAALALVGRHRLRIWEPIPWVLALAFYFAFPNYLGFGTELLITILFALSLDLALGYAG